LVGELARAEHDPLMRDHDTTLLDIKARHHAEWLALTAVAGPFLSLPVLLRAFLEGLDTLDSAVTRAVRLAYHEAAIAGRGSGPPPRLFPVTYLVPAKLARGGVA
jgi:hypothetical protein